MTISSLNRQVLGELTDLENKIVNNFRPSDYSQFKRLAIKCGYQLEKVYADHEFYAARSQVMDYIPSVKAFIMQEEN